MLCQDTLVSLFFARPPCIAILSDSSLPQFKCATPRLLGFADACYHLFSIANEISQELLRVRSTTQRLTMEVIQDYRSRIYRIEGLVVPHMQDDSKCQLREDYIEHNIYRVLSDSVVLCLCRPAVLLCGDEGSQELVDLILNRCRSVLRSYLELLSLDCPTRRLWIHVHVALSCALTLGIATHGMFQALDKKLLQSFFDRVSQATLCASVPAYQYALRQIRGYLDACG